MKPVRTALLGLGRIAWMLEQDTLRYHPCTHAGTLRKFEKLYQLVGIADPGKDRIVRFQKWWDRLGVNAATSSRTILEETRPDFVVIAASLAAHEELFSQAVKASPRAILLEKPPADNYKSAQTMLKMAGNIPVWVNYERRYHPNYVLTKRLIESGKLGDVRSIRGQVLVGHSPGAGEAGPLLHDASHWIDVLLWFVGQPEGVSARLFREKTRAEHSAFVSFHYPGFEAILESGGRRKYFEFEMQIDFSEGRILCGNNGLRVFQSRLSRKYKGFKELQEKRINQVWRNPWLGLYKDIHNVIRHTSQKPVASLSNAVQGMHWINRILIGS
ncbi:MAG: Gfo/Idh/MocA family oxidoreductase [Leptospirales bacterium]|nr:Gfo/Idh/MocA family oxidoreductase [Leptospirales bacterium]